MGRLQVNLKAFFRDVTSPSKWAFMLSHVGRVKDGSLKSNFIISLILLTTLLKAVLTVDFMLSIFVLAVVLMLSQTLETVVLTAEKAFENVVLMPSSFPPVSLFRASNHSV